MSPLQNIFIISGPSGAGEDSIIKGLSRRVDIEKIITSTTRNPRPGEVDGKDYYFISKEKFEEILERDGFAEHAQHYNGNLYGVAVEELNRVQNSGKVGIWKIEYKGVMTVKEKYPEIKAIFINAERLEVLESRIRSRDNVSEEYIRERMEYTKEWLKHLDIYDYHIVNAQGKLEEAIDSVEKIIRENKKCDL